MGVISLCEPVANAAVTSDILNGLLGKDYLVVKHSGFPEVAILSPSFSLALSKSGEP